MKLYTAQVLPDNTTVRVNVIPVERETETNWFVRRSAMTFWRSKVTKKTCRRYGWGLTPAEAIDHLLGVSGFALEKIEQLWGIEDKKYKALKAAKVQALEHPEQFER
jgi:hypothetical protein